MMVALVQQQQCRWESQVRRDKDAVAEQNKMRLRAGAQFASQIRHQR